MVRLLSSYNVRDVEKQYQEERGAKKAKVDCRKVLNIPKVTQRNYSDAQKRAIWRLLALCNDSRRKAEFMIRSIDGYSTFTRRTFCDWEVAEAKAQDLRDAGLAPKRKGKPVDTDFEEAVMNEVILTEI